MDKIDSNKCSRRRFTQFSKKLIRITEGQKVKLESLAKEKQISVNAIIRRILDDYFDKKKMV